MSPSVAPNPFSELRRAYRVGALPAVAVSNVHVHLNRPESRLRGGVHGAEDLLHLGVAPGYHDGAQCESEKSDSGQLELPYLSN
jgi:hypothetical protein